MMTEWLLEDAAPARLPIYASAFAKGASGGGDDDDDDSDDDDDDSDDDDDDDDDEDDLAGMSEDDLRAALKETRESLSKASGSSKVKRDRIKRLRRELDEARKPKSTPPPKKDGEKLEVDVEAIKAEAKREEREASYARVKRTEAKAAFVDRGLSRDAAADLLGFVNFAEIDVDEDGEVDGEALSEEIDRIAKKYPALFVRTRKRRESVAGGGDRNGDTAPKKKLTASEAQAALLTRGSAR